MFAIQRYRLNRHLSSVTDRLFPTVTVAVTIHDRRILFSPVPRSDRARKPTQKTSLACYNRCCATCEISEKLNDITIDITMISMPRKTSIFFTAIKFNDSAMILFLNHFCNDKHIEEQGIFFTSFYYEKTVCIL